MTTTHDHAAVIRAATAALYRKLDAEKRPRAIGKHLEAIDNAAAALQGEREYHRDDAAAVRRERDTEINRLAGELAQARARAERFAQAMLSVRGDVSWASVAAFLQDGDLPEWADPADATEDA